MACFHVFRYLFQNAPSPSEGKTATVITTWQGRPTLKLPHQLTYNLLADKEKMPKKRSQGVYMTKYI